MKLIIGNFGTIVISRSQEGTAVKPLFFKEEHLQNFDRDYPVFGSIRRHEGNDSKQILMLALLYCSKFGLVLAASLRLNYSCLFLSNCNFVIIIHLDSLFDCL